MAVEILVGGCSVMGDGFQNMEGEPSSCGACGSIKSSISGAKVASKSRTRCQLYCWAKGWVAREGKLTPLQLLVIPRQCIDGALRKHAQALPHHKQIGRASC